MKKLIILLALVIVTQANAQVFSLKYTSYHLYDTINLAYSKGIKGDFTCYIDIGQKTMKVVNDKDGKIIYNFNILSVKAYENTLANHCISPADNKIWDVYQITTEENRVLKGKSGNVGWIFKVKIK